MRHARLLIRGFPWNRWRENVPGISGVCATHTFTSVVRGTCLRCWTVRLKWIWKVISYGGVWHFGSQWYWLALSLCANWMLTCYFVSYDPSRHGHDNGKINFINPLGESDTPWSFKMIAIMKGCEVICHARMSYIWDCRFLRRDPVSHVYKDCKSRPPCDACLHREGPRFAMTGDILTNNSLKSAQKLLTAKRHPHIQYYQWWLNTKVYVYQPLPYHVYCVCNAWFTQSECVHDRYFKYHRKINM